MKSISRTFNSTQTELELVQLRIGFATKHVCRRRLYAKVKPELFSGWTISTKAELVAPKQSLGGYVQDQRQKWASYGRFFVLW
jgi:hypothetical protein